MREVTGPTSPGVSPAPGIAQNHHQPQQGPAETPAGLQSSSSKTQRLSPGTTKATCLLRGCPEPLVIHFQGLGPCFRVSSAPGVNLLDPQALGRRTWRLQPFPTPHWSFRPGHQGCFVPVCFWPPQQADRHRSYHQQDNRSSDDAEATHHHDGHTVLRKAWFGLGGLQGGLWDRAQWSAQPAGHRALTPWGSSHPLPSGMRDAQNIDLTLSMPTPAHSPLRCPSGRQQTGVHPQPLPGLCRGTGHGWDGSCR